MALPQTTQYLPRSQRYDLQAGLAARVYDPAWMLLRQWQMGEFRGEDAGTPVQVVIDHDSFMPSRVVTPDGARPYKPEEMPLETLVERESKGSAAQDIRTRSQWGQLLFDFLTRAGLAHSRRTLLGHFAFSDADRDEWRTQNAAVGLLLQRSVDSESIYRAVSSGVISDQQLSHYFPNAVPADFPRYRQAIQDWVKAYEAQTGRTDSPSAWRQDRLEYSFQLEAPTDIGKVTLDAAEYHGGRLNWETFRVSSVAAADRTPPVKVNRRDTVLPSPVTYAGMPAPRFWEFEDGSVDFGNPEASEHDLGRLLLAEFAMSWGNDWFMVPVELSSGTLCRINEVLVTDTFGITTRITPQSRQAPHWSLAHLSQDVNTLSVRDFLYLPAVLPACHESPKIEEVIFLRDEAANVAWAIEQFVADPLGRPQPVANQAQRGERGVDRLKQGHDLSYRPITDLPEHWVPMVPMRDTATNARFLAKAALRDDLGLEAPKVKGAILQGSPEFVRVYDEEIPREGAEVSRAYQLARWYDGRRAIWVGRRKRAGVGELRSNLEFDTLVDASS